MIFKKRYLGLVLICMLLIVCFTFTASAQCTGAGCSKGTWYALTEGQDVNKSTISLASEENQNDLFTLDLERLFQAQTNNDAQIRYLVFVLDPYKSRDKAIHQNTSGDYKDWESNSVDLGLCSSVNDEGSKADAPCLKVDMVNDVDCSLTADVNSYLCEGGAYDLDPTLGKPGYDVDGHLASDEERPRCQFSDIDEDDASQVYKLLGWDWGADYVDVDNNLASTVGYCCGNDPEDAGYIGGMDESGTASSEDGSIVVSNQVLCVRDETIKGESPNRKSLIDGNEGDFVWKDATVSGNPFSIQTVVDSNGYTYDVISNAWSWFVCLPNESGRTYDGLYPPAYDENGLITDSDENPTGVRLEEYQELPKSPENVWSGTDHVGESSNNDNSNDYASSQEGVGRVDIVDVNEFYDMEFSGTPLEMDVCDKDGDGVDGAWTDDSGAVGSPADDCGNSWKSDNDCSDAQPGPDGCFDCDDGNQNRRPGGIEICNNGIDDDCNSETDDLADCQAEANNRPENQWSPERMAKRFMCFEEQDKGRIAECCGSSLAFCKNPYPRGRRQGEVVDSIKEFTCSDDQNCVLKYGITKPLNTEARYPIWGNDFDLNITNWDDYRYLEFYIFFSTDFAADLVLAKPGSGSSRLISGYQTLWRGKITDYVVNQPALRKWLHVRIPLKDLDVKDVQLLYFATRTEDSSGASVTWGGTSYSNIIGIDKMHLVKGEGPSETETRFCSGVWPQSPWITDLDNATNAQLADWSSSETEAVPVGKAACNEFPSYAWTGTNCCGDDAGNDIDNPAINIIEEGNRENYVDSEGACLGSEPIKDNQKAMVIQYTFKKQGEPNVNVNSICTDDNCLFPIRDHYLGYYIWNGLGTSETARTNEYSLEVFNDDSNAAGKVGVKSAILAKHSSLKVENIKYQLLYSAGEGEDSGKFYGCNASQYIMNLDNDLVEDGKLIKSSDDNKDFCESQGSYFCSFNEGWSNKSCNRYGSTLENPKIVLAKDRRNRSLAFNLVDNGGFESTTSSANSNLNGPYDLVYVLNDLYRFGGTHKLVFDMNANGGGSDPAKVGDYVSQFVTVEPSTTYTVSFYYRILSGSAHFDVMNGTPSREQILEFDSQPGSDIGQWVKFNKTFTTASDMTEVELVFKGESLDDVYELDAVSLIEAPEDIGYFEFDSKEGCCPENFCWTGNTFPSRLKSKNGCVDSGWFEKSTRELPYAVNAEGSGFRCINGSWDFARAKWDPLHQDAGYCPNDNDCFLGGSDDPKVACVNSTDPVRKYTYTLDRDTLEDPVRSDFFYCHEGKWTTRTKVLALQLLNLTKPEDDYTLFCDAPEKSLNPDESGNMWRGKLKDQSALQSLLGIQLNAENFDAGITSYLNEFCVLNLNGQIIAATSFNGIHPNEVPEDVASIGDVTFLEALKGESSSGANDYCGDEQDENSALGNPENTFKPCGNEGGKKDIWYNSKSRMIIFTMDNQELNLDGTQSFFGKVFSTIKDTAMNLLRFFGVIAPLDIEQHESDIKFVNALDSFDKIYVNHNSKGHNGKPRDIRAVREVKFESSNKLELGSGDAPDELDVSGIKDGEFREALTVEYQNYAVDICDYFVNQMNSFLRNSITDSKNGMTCTPIILNQDEWMFKVFVENPKLELGESGEEFWNDLTAKVRTLKPKAGVGGSIASNKMNFELVDEGTPVTGSELMFDVTEEPDNILARTWDFGDGTLAGEYLNKRQSHTYLINKTYDATLWLMDKNFKIGHITKSWYVDQGLYVQISSVSQGTVNKNFDVGATIYGGKSPFDYSVDWDGDGLFDYSSDDAGLSPVEREEGKSYVSIPSNQCLITESGVNTIKVVITDADEKVFTAEKDVVFTDKN